MMKTWNVIVFFTVLTYFNKSCLVQLSDLEKIGLSYKQVNIGNMLELYLECFGWAWLSYVYAYAGAALV